MGRDPVETYAYDGDGSRFSRQVGSGPVTRYVTDSARGLPVTIDDGSRKYVWGLGLAFAVTGSSIEVYHADRLGSVRALTDGAGIVTASYRSDEFGIPTASSGASVQPFRYTGEPLDASGLTYLRARYYDPSLGRFMSRDPLAGNYEAPVTLNRFGYARNNPATWSDPSGLTPSSKAMEHSDPWPQAGFDPNTGVAPYGSGYDNYLFAKGGKQNIRDTGLIGVSDEEVTRRAKDKTLSPQERQRYITEDKARKQRHSGQSKITENLDGTGAVIVGVVGAVGTALWWAAKLLSPACGPLAPACALAL